MRRWKRVGASKTAVVEYEGLPYSESQRRSQPPRAKLGLMTSRRTPCAIRRSLGRPRQESRSSRYRPTLARPTRIVENVYAHHAPDAGSAVHRALERKPA